MVSQEEDVHLGGYSGSGRSSSRSSSSSSRSSYNSGSSYRGSSSSRSSFNSIPHFGYIPFVRTNPTYRSNNNQYSNGGSNSNAGCSKALIAIVVIIILLIIIGSLTSPVSDNPANIKNTKERVALSGVVKKTDWYSDNLDWISNRNELISGLETFYNKTGVQPYILFIKYSDKFWNNDSFITSSAKEYLENYYDSNFKDEGHFIFAYFECRNDSKIEMDGEFLHLAGTSADTILDNEAIKIFYGYFDANYRNDSLSIEAMISDTFSQTAKSIMSKPTNGWDALKVIVIVVGILAVAVIIYFIIQNKHQREKEKEEYTKEILSKPLETFGQDTSELEKKYDNKDGSQ